MQNNEKSTFARTDLAQESAQFLQLDLEASGATVTETKSGIDIFRLTVTEGELARALQKPAGRYITLSGYDLKKPPIAFADMVEVFKTELESLLPRSDRPILVVGLGNQRITPDAVGPEVVSYLIATRHLPKELLTAIGLTADAVCAIAPGVLGQTGMESAEIVAHLTKNLTPAAVIAIDALAAADRTRLGSTIQLCDTGISPGSGVLNARKELSEKTLGCPVIAIGVPTVMDLSQAGEDPMMVTPREVDTLIDHAAKVIGYGINRTLHPTLSLEEIAALSR